MSRNPQADSSLTMAAAPMGIPLPSRHRAEREDEQEHDLADRDAEQEPGPPGHGFRSPRAPRRTLLALTYQTWLRFARPSSEYDHIPASSSSASRIASRSRSFSSRSSLISGTSPHRARRYSSMAGERVTAPAPASRMFGRARERNAPSRGNVGKSGRATLLPCSRMAVPLSPMARTIHLLGTWGSRFSRPDTRNTGSDQTSDVR